MGPEMSELKGVQGPSILDARGIILKISIDRYLRLRSAPVWWMMPTMEKGDVLGLKQMSTAWIQSATASKSHPISAPIVPTRCGRRSCNAARAEQSRFQVSIIGVLDKIPFGAATNKGLTLKMGQTQVQKYLQPLLRKGEAGEIDPSFVITHKIKLQPAPGAYKTFRDKKDGCIKVVINP
jgi:hypothetical protein